MSLEPLPELQFLIHRYVDGDATADEVAQLNDLLRMNIDARRIFAEHLGLDAALAEVAADSHERRAMGNHAGCDGQGVLADTIASTIMAAAFSLMRGGAGPPVYGPEWCADGVVPPQRRLTGWREPRND